jgi:hypothetical protein
VEATRRLVWPVSWCRVVNMARNYDVFISYSHRADTPVAKRLEAGLKSLNRKWNERRALEVFRDESSLSAAPHLWDTLATQLDGVRYGLVLLSPEAVESPWVGREIDHFLSTHGEDRLLLALTEGELVWDDDANDWADSSTAVPAGLRGRLSAEPLWVDLRWARDVNDLTLRDTRFRAAVATLAAPVHGMSRDELEGEDVRAYRRFVRIRRAAISALVLLLSMALLASVLALVSRGQTNSERSLRRQVQAGAAELEQTNKELDATNGKLDSTNKELSVANGKLDTANASLVELEAFASTAAGAAICSRAAVEATSDLIDGERVLFLTQAMAMTNAYTGLLQKLDDPATSLEDARNLATSLTTVFSVYQLSGPPIPNVPELQGTCSTIAGYPFRDDWSTIVDLPMNASIASYLPNCQDLVHDPDCPGAAPK